MVWVGVGLGTVSLLCVGLRFVSRYLIAHEVWLDDWAIFIAAVSRAIGGYQHLGSQLMAKCDQIIYCGIIVTDVLGMLKLVQQEMKANK